MGSNSGSLYSRDHVFAVLKEQIRAEGGQNTFARKHGLSPQFINDVVHGRRAITTVLAAALGFRPANLFERIEGVGEEQANETH